MKMAERVIRSDVGLDKDAKALCVLNRLYKEVNVPSDRLPYTLHMERFHREFMFSTGYSLSMRRFAKYVFSKRKLKELELIADEDTETSSVLTDDQRDHLRKAWIKEGHPRESVLYTDGLMLVLFEWVRECCWASCEIPGLSLDSFWQEMLKIAKYYSKWRTKRIKAGDCPNWAIKLSRKKKKEEEKVVKIPPRVVG